MAGPEMTAESVFRRRGGAIEVGRRFECHWAGRVVVVLAEGSVQMRDMARVHRGVGWTTGAPGWGIPKEATYNIGWGWGHQAWACDEGFRHQN